MKIYSDCGHRTKALQELRVGKFWTEVVRTSVKTNQGKQVFPGNFPPRWEKPGKYCQKLDYNGTLHLLYLCLSLKGKLKVKLEC